VATATVTTIAAIPIMLAATIPATWIFCEVSRPFQPLGALSISTA
jgi:hypothetical protein